MQKQMSARISEVQDEFHRFSALSRISESMSTNISKDELLNLIIETCECELNPDIHFIVIFERNTGKELVNCRIEQDKSECQKIINKQKDLINYVVNDRAPLLIIDEMAEPRLKDERIKSIIIVPLRVQDTVIGYIVAARYKKAFNGVGRNYNINDYEFMLIIASQLAYSLENARLYKAANDKIHELNKLNEIGKALNSSLNKRNVISQIIESIKDMINVHVGILFIMQDSEPELNLIITRKITKKCLSSISEKSIEAISMLTGRDFSKEEIKINVTKGHKYLEHQKAIRSIGTILNVPLLSRGEVIGLLGICHEKKRHYSKDNFRTLSTFATQVAIAIENATTYEKMEKRLDELSRLSQISELLSTSLDLEKVLNMIVKVTAQLFNAKICSLCLIEENSDLLTIKATFGIDEISKRNAPMNIKVGEGIMGTVASTGQALSVTDVSKDPRVKYKSFALKHGIKSVLSVPLKVKNKVIGVLNIYNKTKKIYKQSEINLLYTLGAQAAQAIENAKLYTAMQENYLSTIKALAAAIDTKDHYTHGHSEKVMEYAVLIAKELNLADEEIETIRFAGLLHDIGKIGISEMILLKKDKLTEEEFEIISTHPRLGNFILSRVKYLQKIAPLTYHHHERWDGKGYPMGLKGEDIPLGSRILSVADTFDAITSSRSYRKAKSAEEAIEEIRKCAGTQFDPRVVEAFIRVVRKHNIIQGINSSIKIKKKKGNVSRKKNIFKI